MNHTGSRTRRRAGIRLFATAALFGAGLSTARADDATQPRFVMTVAAQSRGADSLVARDTTTAIKQIRYAWGRNAGPFEIATNYCVAWTLKGNLAKAKGHCDRAVLLARDSTHYALPMSRDHEDTAVALSNRGVLRALSGQLQGARRDLERSDQLDREEGAAAQNLLKLEQLERQAAERAPNPATQTIS